MGQEHSTPPRTNLLTSKLGCCASHEALTTVTLSYRFRSSARSSKWPIYMYLFIRNFQLGDIFKIFCRDSILADSKIDLRCRKLQVFEPYQKRTTVASEALFLFRLKTAYSPFAHLSRQKSQLWTRRLRDPSETSTDIDFVKAGVQKNVKLRRWLPAEALQPKALPTEGSLTEALVFGVKSFESSNSIRNIPL